MCIIGSVVLYREVPFIQSVLYRKFYCTYQPHCPLQFPSDPGENQIAPLLQVDMSYDARSLLAAVLQSTGSQFNDTGNDFMRCMYILNTMY